MSEMASMSDAVYASFIARRRGLGETRMALDAL